MITTPKKRTSLQWFLFACLAILAAWALPAAAARNVEERFTANLVDVAAGVSGAPVVIEIRDYSTRQEVDRLAGILAAKGPAAVEEEIWNVEKGWIRVGNSLGYPLAVATSRRTPQGRRISLLLDRQVEFYEKWRGLRSADYPFGYIELNLDRNGRGEGRLIPAGQVRLNNGSIEVVAYGFQPARLLNVQTRR